MALADATPGTRGHCYLLERFEQLGGGAKKARRRKVFHVSPFIAIDDVAFGRWGYPHMTARTIFLIHWQALKL
ncbi:hypothetical protein BH18GEM1_BH18GEM1_08530 [soil metagenome]